MSTGPAWPPELPPAASAVPLTGGMVGATQLATLADGRLVVVKRSPYPADAEADGLRALAKAGVPVPAVLGHSGTTMVLEYLRGEPDWPALGRAVAALHQAVGPAFGWHRDNFSGRFAQRNDWSTSWPQFYAEQRIRVHLTDQNVPVDLRDRLERACAGPLLDLLPTHPMASLTHGDLWVGNVVDGRWIIDPEVSYADRELDLAYMQMSDSLPPAFWSAYQQILQFEPRYERRRPALTLHHRLLQMRHFGPDRFRPGVEAVLDHYGW